MENSGQESRFMRIIAMPIKVLAKARDFYVKSMNNFAHKACYGGAAMGPMTGDPLLRSFSVSSTRLDDSADLTQLLRAASTRVKGDRIDLSGVQRQEKQGKVLAPPQRAAGTAVVGLKKVPRTCSVSMAKIDEDKACEFGNDGVYCSVNLKEENNKGSGSFGRGRSYAARKQQKRNMRF
ncbi:hypothetical protein Ancab_016569 [Ancistrocladus abbreviatus]